MSSLNKRVNPPPKIAISGAMVTSSSGDDVVLTTPDIAGTVTTPGMMDMLSKNSVPTFNQFSLAPVSSATTTTPNSTTITTMTPVHASQTHTVHYAEPSIKREPHDEARNYVDLDHQKPKPNYHNLPEIASVGTVGGPLSVIPVNMDDQERQKLERKRERNRLAATKCRQRKIQKINVLEEEVRVLTERNNNLKNERKHLQDELVRLESQLRMPITVTHPAAGGTLYAN